MAGGGAPVPRPVVCVCVCTSPFLFDSEGKEGADSASLPFCSWPSSNGKHSLAAGAAAQVAAQEDTQPSVNTEDGNTKINIPRGKVFGAGLVTADGTTKVDLIQKIQQLKQRLQALKDSVKEPDWAKANLGRTTGTEFITGGEKTMSLGYFGQNQGIKVEVKVDGCGIYQGRRFTVVTSQKVAAGERHTVRTAQPPFLKAGESNPLLDVEVLRGRRGQQPSQRPGLHSMDPQLPRTDQKRTAPRLRRCTTG